MVDFTFIELHVEDGSFSANLPFSGGADDEASDETDDEPVSDGDVEEEVGTGSTAEDGGRGKGPALLGVFLFFVVVAAVVKYLSGDEDGPEVEIETADDGPVGVTVDTDGE
jgi:hypothetical protein